MSMFNAVAAMIASGIQTLSNIAANTATVTGAAVAVAGFTGNLVVIQNVGVVSGTTPTLDGKIQDSVDGSAGWADVAGATFTQVTASNNVQAIAVNADATRGFIRYVGTIAGTTPSFTSGATALGIKVSV